VYTGGVLQPKDPQPDDYTAMLNACTFMIFGATGNLSQVKLMPALYHLEVEKRLPDGCAIVGSGRRDWSQSRWIDEVRKMVAAKAHCGLNEAVFSRFQERLHDLRGDLDNAATFDSLRELLTDSSGFLVDIAFYLSISPAGFANVAEQLSRVGLLEEERGWRRVVIEKPFGYDIDGARLLQQRLRRTLREDQLYRIDHYLGQRHGTERACVAFRECADGAVVEQKLHRPCANHPLGDRWGESARGLLRSVRCLTRHVAEPFASVAHLSCHGATRCNGSRGASRREGEGVEIYPTHGDERREDACVSCSV